MSCERDELAYHGRLQAADGRVQSGWDDIARQQGDPESGGGEMRGGDHLTGLHGSTGNEAGACAHFEDELRETVVCAEQDPVAVGQLLERWGTPAASKRVGAREDGDELLPSQADDRTGQLGWSRANRDVTGTCAHGVIECPAMLVLAKHNRRGRIARVPELEGRR